MATLPSPAGRGEASGRVPATVLAHAWLQFTCHGWDMHGWTLHCFYLGSNPQRNPSQSFDHRCHWQPNRVAVHPIHPRTHGWIIQTRWQGKAQPGYLYLHMHASVARVHVHYTLPVESFHQLAHGQDHIDQPYLLVCSYLSGWPAGYSEAGGACEQQTRHGSVHAVPSNVCRMVFRCIGMRASGPNSWLWTRTRMYTWGENGKRCINMSTRGGYMHTKPMHALCGLLTLVRDVTVPR